MTLVSRVLPDKAIPDLQAYIDGHDGGRALELSRRLEATALVEELEASGLRGRGGAGFPTGTKWRTVAEHRSEVVPATVVVNAAEGEPGTFKDRTILRLNPYHVLEGALVAARVVGADAVIFGLKASFGPELARLRTAIDEATAAGWTDGLTIDVLEGPSEYLYGEETALLEVAAGRPPLPRIAPPFRRGADEVVESVDDVHSGSGLSATVDMASDTGATEAPPTLVDNVETLANVPAILVKGSEWFRQVGTMESPGTIVCTITGRVQTPGVRELALGTTLGDAIQEVGGGLASGRTVTAVIPGVSNAFLTSDQLDTPLTYEAMAAAGSGLGSAGYIVLDNTDDVVSAAAGVSRFLAVESCGQCTPCKQDGLAMADTLALISRSGATEHDLEELLARTATVADGARCNLALQQQAVASGLLQHWSPTVADHISGEREARDPMVIAEIVDVDETGVIVDIRHADKQPDWTYDDEDSGAAPADRLTDRRQHTGAR